MKEIVTMWIVFQLIAIGIAGVSLHNEIVNKTYDCKRGVVPEWVGAVFPLVTFVPETQFSIDYCKLNKPL